MAELLIYRGLPGSGKSSAALDELKRRGNAIRVNRDSLRIMLHGDGVPWSNQRENETAAAELEIARQALMRGKTVIVDNTHCSQRSLAPWENLRNEVEKAGVGVKWRVEDLTAKVSIAECIQRDSWRQGPARVGRGVIDRMALRNKLIDLSGLENVAIVDLDGTLANLNHRLHYLDETPKDYNLFFAEVGDDGIYTTIFDAVLKLQARGFKIIALSGRPTSCGYLTNCWLNGHVEREDAQIRQLNPAFLFMRQAGDKRPDFEAKAQIYGWMLECGLRKESIKIVFDDREAVCKLWRDNGLPLVKVEEGSAIEIAPTALQLVVDLKIPIK